MQAPTDEDGHLFPPRAEQVDQRELSCGRCRGCQADLGGDWAARCLNELSYHSTACFITLTYAPEHLPEDGGLSRYDLTCFFKRLRDQRGAFRYFACGEYGPSTLRPHYHAVIFGMDFWPETDQVAKAGTDRLTWYTPTGTRIWGRGRVTWTFVDSTNVAYLCAYTGSKLGKRRALRNGDPDPAYARTMLDGRTHYVEPEFQVMSRRKGIGSRFCEDHAHQLVSMGHLTQEGGYKRRLPRYYLNKLRESHPAEYEALKVKRHYAASAAEEARPSDWRSARELRFNNRLRNKPRGN